MTKSAANPLCKHALSALGVWHFLKILLFFWFVGFNLLFWVVVFRGVSSGGGSCPGAPRPPFHKPPFFFLPSGWEREGPLGWGPLSFFFSPWAPFFSSLPGLFLSPFRFSFISLPFLSTLMWIVYPFYLHGQWCGHSWGLTSGPLWQGRRWHTHGGRDDITSAFAPDWRDQKQKALCRSGVTWWAGDSTCCVFKMAAVWPDTRLLPLLWGSSPLHLWPRTFLTRNSKTCYDGSKLATRLSLAFKGGCSNDRATILIVWFCISQTWLSLAWSSVPPRDYIFLTAAQSSHHQ